MHSRVMLVVFLAGLLGAPLVMAQGVEKLSVMRQQSEQALERLHDEAAARGGLEGRRARILVALAQADGRYVTEADLVWLERYRQAHPQDLFGKLYEGYGWLLTAERYRQQQNYFRAAELAKRGFFLVDEAVDQQPGNWRLRLLRVRMDVAVPGEFGRYVVALDDLHELAEASAPPPALQDLLIYLKARALNAAGRHDEAGTLFDALSGTPLAAAASGEETLFLTPLEIEHVLGAALETGE